MTALTSADLRFNLSLARTAFSVRSLLRYASRRDRLC